MRRAIRLLLVMSAISLPSVARAETDTGSGEIAALRRELRELALQNHQQIDALQRQVRSLSAELAAQRGKPTTVTAPRSKPTTVEALPIEPKPESTGPGMPKPLVLAEPMLNLPGRSAAPPYTGPGPGALGPAPVTPAAAMTSGGNKVALSISGQLNRALLWGNDGVSSNLRQVDNNNSSSRFRIVGEAQPIAGTVAGMNLETEIRPNSSATQTLTQDQPQAASAVTFTVRQAEIYGSNAEYGGLRLGFGSTASYLTAEIDLSGTAVASYEIVSDFNGGFAFRQKAGAMVPGGAKGAFVFSPRNAFGPAVASVFNSFDGLGRDVRLRYDSPFWEGFQVSTSVLDGGAVDVAGRFAREYDDFKIVAGVGLGFADGRTHTQPGAYGYAGVPAGAGGISLGGTNAAPNSPTTADVSPNGSNQLGGSFSVVLKNGLNFTMAGGARDPSYHDPNGRSLNPDLIYAKLGYQQHFLPIGLTAFSVDFAQNDELIFAKDQARAYGISAVQNIDQFGLELFVTGRYETLHRAFASYHPITAVMSGGRVRF